jgi:hypothetical protein
VEAAVSRYRERSRAVVEIVCHRHPEKVLQRITWDIESGTYTTRRQPLAGVPVNVMWPARCRLCATDGQYSQEKVRLLMLELPKGVWRVTVGETDRLIRHPGRAAEYLARRDGFATTERQ